MNMAGEVKMERGEFWYVGESGNWLAVKIWVQGDKFCLATNDLKEQYSVAGELRCIAQIPVEPLRKGSDGKN